MYAIEEIEGENRSYSFPDITDPHVIWYRRNIFGRGRLCHRDISHILDTLRRQTPADFLMLSAVRGSALAAQLKRLTPVVYRTRLYQVLFHDSEPQDVTGLSVDVSFL